MSTNEELVAALGSLRRGSMIALPLALIAFFAIVSMVWFAGRELQGTRAQVEQVREELDRKQNALSETTRAVADKQAELASTLAQLEAAKRLVREAEQSIENLSVTSPRDAQNQATALERLAVADASLTVASAQSGSDGSTTNASAYGAFSVDVFYCENQGAKVQQDADSVVKQLQGSASGRWRLRVLRESVNRGSGYQLRRNEIRYNVSEEQVAKALQADARAQLGLTFALISTDYPTPNYLSAFVCTDGR